MFEYYDDGTGQPPFDFSGELFEGAGESYGEPFGRPIDPFGGPGGPFGGPPGRPPMGPPGGPQGGPQGRPPMGPPPAFTPQQTHGAAPGAFAIDAGAIRPCMHRFVYLWLNTGEQFWAWLTFVGRRSVAGWRWTGFRWIYFGVDLRNIASFRCF